MVVKISEFRHRHGQGRVLNFKISIRMGKKGSLSVFECDVFVSVR